MRALLTPRCYTQNCGSAVDGKIEAHTGVAQLAERKRLRDAAEKAAVNK